MPAQVTSFFRRLATSVQQFTIAQRTVALIGVAVLVLGIAALAMWASKPAFTPLFSGLSGTDANTIVEQLRTDGVPYELSNGGTTVLVPEGNVYDERLKAAAAGLPSSETGGYSLLDKIGVTSSEFQQSITYKRALEGELATTIEALRGVQTASVRLAIPEETVFVSEKSDPTASVFIGTENGVTLDSEQVQAIVHLTSASIDGMAPADVAVIDANGAVLSAVGIGVGGSAGTQAADYEERVRTAVQSMLDQVVGPGNASVVVAADMSHESAERVEESFATPVDAPALIESLTTEEYAGGAGGAAGALGPDNIAVPAAVGGDGTFNSESMTRNNAVNKITESRTIPAGSLDRQSVSVALNAAVAGDLNVDDVAALVASAAGIDDGRGDAVTVELVDFNTAGADEAAAALAAAEEVAAAERIADIIRFGIVTGAVLVAFILGLILYARRSRRQRREVVEIGELNQVRPELELSTVPIGLEASRVPALLPPTERLDLPQQDADHRLADIDALAAQDPQKTAEFLRGLMDDRQAV
jgi:flagellar M-ring protein FliF